MTQRDQRSATLPVVEEHLRVGKRKVEQGRVRVSTRTHKKLQPVREQLLQENVVVKRVSINRFSDSEPEVRREGDVLIVPVFEEVLVKRILLREEIRISRKRRVAKVEDVVSLRTQDAVVERTPQVKSHQPRSPS